MTFGKWIIDQLEIMNISIYQLEKDCNFGKGAVYRWDSKGHYPRMDSFLRVINQLSIYSGQPVQVLLIEALLKIEVK